MITLLEKQDKKMNSEKSINEKAVLIQNKISNVKVTIFHNHGMGVL